MNRLIKSRQQRFINTHLSRVGTGVLIGDEYIYMSTPEIALVDPISKHILQKSKVLRQTEGKIQKTMIDSLELKSQFPSVAAYAMTSVASHALHETARLLHDLRTFHYNITRNKKQVYEQ